METNRRPIPNRLKMHRRLHGMSQRQVATLLGFQTAAQVSQWESGTAMPGGTDLIKLGIIYNTFPNDLYFEHYQELREGLKADPGSYSTYRD